MAAGFIHMIEEALRQFSALSQQTLPPLSKFSYRANLQNDGDSVPLSRETLASAEAGTGLGRAYAPLLRPSVGWCIL
jgi:hypothetical protein